MRIHIRTHQESANASHHWLFCGVAVRSSLTGHDIIGHIGLKGGLVEISKYNAVPMTTPRISYRNSEAVVDYLAHHPEIEEFLEATWPAVVKYFGESVDIVLEVVFYPEEGDYSELAGWIQCPGDVLDGLEKLEQFEDEWLEKQLGTVGNKFNFNVEFE